MYDSIQFTGNRPYTVVGLAPVQVLIEILIVMMVQKLGRNLLLYSSFYVIFLILRNDTYMEDPRKKLGILNLIP